MKRLSVTGGLLGLLAGLSLLGTSGAFAATPKPAGVGPKFPAGTTNIVFDGFCDGMTITNPGSAGAPGAQGVHTGSCLPNTAAVYGAAAGAGVALGDVNEGPGNVNNIVWLIETNHTWTIYQDCGSGSECVLASGTWSLGTPAAPAGRNASNSRAAGGLFGATEARRLPGPKVSGVSGLNISFDGFCDGEQLNVPGGAGSPGADGIETGCQVNPLIGVFARGAGFVGMFDYTDALFYVINADHTWILYNDCGDGTECFLNSGTWSFGAPVAPQGNRTLVPSSLRH